MFMAALDKAVRTIRQSKRPFALTDQDPMYDLCLADPQNGIEDWGRGKRATSCSFGLTPVLEFMERSSIKGIIISHEVVGEDYSYPFGKDVNFVTLFSVPGYCGQTKKYCGKQLFINIVVNLIIIRF